MIIARIIDAVFRYTIILTFDEIFAIIGKDKISIYFIWFSSCEIGCYKL